jgi:hypothetical protein
LTKVSIDTFIQEVRNLVRPGTDGADRYPKELAGGCIRHLEYRRHKVYSMDRERETALRG